MVMAVYICIHRAVYTCTHVEGQAFSYIWFLCNGCVIVCAYIEVDRYAGMLLLLLMMFVNVARYRNA